MTTAAAGALPRTDTVGTRLGPQSVTWRLAGDARFVLLLGRAFLLQVMHPTISAGVIEHSTFKSDPWTRLERSWTLVLRTIYDADGEAVGGRVREAHKGIRGVDGDRRRYSAFEPEAYWWVLASGFDSLMAFAEITGQPLSDAERVEAYEETRELGRRLGLRDRDMPAALPEFERWYSDMLRQRIRDTTAGRDVLAVMRNVPRPAAIPQIAWPPLRLLTHRIGWLMTVGTLPAVARERLGLDWTAGNRAQFLAINQALRAAGSVPRGWRYLPLAKSAFEREDARTECGAGA